MENYTYKTIIKLTAIISIMVGVVVMMGWFFSVKELTAVFSSYSSMKFNTAVCFILLSVVLLLLFHSIKYTKRVQKILSAFIFLVGIISFSEYFINYTIGIDEFFVKDIFYKTSSIEFPGRMGLASASCFCLMGIAFAFFHSTNKLIRIITQWQLHIVTFIAMLALIGYIFDVPGIFKMVFFGTMAIQTAVLFFVLSIAATLVNPSFGITNLFSGDRIGNIMARRLFPMMVALSLVFTFIRVQVFRHNWIDKELTTVLFTTAFILLNLFLIWRASQQLNKIDVQRKIAEESISTLNKNLEKKVEQRTKTLKETLSQLEETQKEVSEALNKEKELNEMKSRFVSMASHEFKTPLSTILSSASLISSYSKPESTASREKHVQYIKNSVRHLNGLLEDFLSLGKLEEGHIKTNAISFDLKEFLEDTVEEMSPGLKKGQSIQIEQEGENNFITDKRLLKNILLNILSNAIKFSPEFSDISIQLKNNQTDLNIIVSDKGIGIPEEDQKHLFSSFFRGNNTLNIEGTGLGLHIVERYILLLNGRINIQSALGKGTSIKISLPRLHQQILSSVIT